MQPATTSKPTVHDVLTGPFWRRQWLTIFISIILIGGTATFIWMTFMSVPDTLGPFAPGGIILMLGVLIYIISAIWRQAYKRTAWHNYSLRVGGTYSFDKLPMSDAFVFQRGAYRQIYDQITNPTELPFSAFGNYGYYYYIMYNSGGYGTMTGYDIPLIPRKVSFFALPLQRHLPHIILDSKKNNLLHRFSEYGLEIKSMQRLELEGEFMNYFNLYAPEGYQRDALYLFSPDVMELMVRYAADYDIEIIDNTLYLFSPGLINITNSVKLARATAVGTAILQKFDKNASQYTDSSVANHIIDTVAPAGRRLKTRTIPIVIITLVALLLCMLYGNLPGK